MIIENQISKKATNQITNFDELPLTLTIDDLVKILGLSKSNIYKLCHSDGFPCITVGKRLIIPKPAFIKWMENPLKEESEVKSNGKKK